MAGVSIMKYTKFNGNIFAYDETQDELYLERIKEGHAPADASSVDDLRPKSSIASLLERAKSEIRTMRAPMLDALTGIAGRAARAGNDTLATEADALAEQLLDITDDAALNAATTYEAMRAAGVDAYKRMAASSSPELASVFREITGA